MVLAVWFKICVFFFIVITSSGSSAAARGGARSAHPRGIGTILSQPALWIQVVFGFFLFIANFGILMGPMLAMNLTQIKTLRARRRAVGREARGRPRPGGGEGGGRRVVSIWQSGEQFERHGGKRERGVLFLGAPGHGQDDAREGDRDRVQLAVRLDSGLGLCATFIGIDAIVVRYLAWKAKRLARKWGGTCIVFIDEIDAVGMRRQRSAPGSAERSTRLRSRR